jgi:hypothetical protein
MNEIHIYRDIILLNSDNDGIIKELLAQNRNYNTFWGSEYIIMNEKTFIDNNFEEIIELMVKSRSILKLA